MRSPSGIEGTSTSGCSERQQDKPSGSPRRLRRREAAGSFGTTLLMKQNLPILAVLLLSLVAVVSGQNPAPPVPSAPATPTKPDAAADIKVASAPYHAAVEAVSAEYQKWVASLETWYLAELDKLQAARAKLGDLDGAIAIKKERERMASHSPTTPEQIQAMPAPLRTLRTGYDQGLKKSADEGARRIDVARRKYLADLGALQKRITTAGDIDQALLVKAEKERFIAEMAAGPGVPIPGTIPGGTSAATPAAATKDKPFVNSLGMEFVPVPGAQVLFCRWETRVKDYAEYAGVNKVDDSWKKQERGGVPAGREPEHPVCGVNWDDANAFCKWLSEKEAAEGKLPKGMKYRLPTDEDWSRAVGLAKEEGATPKERSVKNNVDFPWGTGFPPPKAKVGNYGDSAWKEAFPNETSIPGYTDGYATTSPVGSFPPNKHGIFDLGGNVWEWCEESIEPGRNERVVRGASWHYNDRDRHLSSWREPYPQHVRGFNTGFRCVLGASAR